MGEYWGELKIWETRENAGRGKLAKTYNDVGGHAKYHFGNEDGGPYVNNGKEGGKQKLHVWSRNS